MEQRESQMQDLDGLNNTSKSHLMPISDSMMALPNRVDLYETIILQRVSKTQIRFRKQPHFHLPSVDAQRFDDCHARQDLRFYYTMRLHRSTLHDLKSVYLRKHALEILLYYLVTTLAWRLEHATVIDVV